MLHICKNCFNSYNGRPEVCPHCGEPLNNNKKKVQQETGSNNQQEQKASKKTRLFKKRISSAEIMDSINFEDLAQKTTDNSVHSWRERKKKDRRPEFNVKDGELDINTSDVTYLPQTYTYSAKKARGEYKKPKIKWWEIYKWADVMLARRKIKKQVKKASYYKPVQFSAAKMITLCILFGWLGLHNFYARNYRKAWFTLIACVLGLTIIFTENPFFNAIRISIGGGLMFIVMFMWITDFIDLCFAKYKYRLSKYKFIDSLNLDTRATLGTKYIDKDEYKKLWTVRQFNKIKNAINNKKEQKAKQTGSEQSASSEASESSLSAAQSVDAAINCDTDSENKTNTIKFTEDKSNNKNSNKQNKKNKPKVIKINNKNEK